MIENLIHLKARIEKERNGLVLGKLIKKYWELRNKYHKTKDVACYFLKKHISWKVR